jgi:ATP phosphoribosyltransferase regulatory subunit
VTGRALARAEARRLVAHFGAFGAREVEAPVLLDADALLDLYGEDVRARAFTTHGPRGELMLRPDFTVPVVRMHMETEADPARYAYAGEVFRRRDDAPAESLQVGYEVFGSEPAEADAEVFRAVSTAVADLSLRAAIGDVGLLRAAVAGLATSEARRAALLRHLWRPRRFTALLERFAAPPAPRAPARVPEGAPEIGARTRAEVEERLALLDADRDAPLVGADEVRLIEALLALRAPAPAALASLREVAAELPAVAAAVDAFARRLDALAARGVAVEALGFEGSFGRTTLEYYDGFVFGLFADARPDLPPVATGGRYDALTAALGGGRRVPAVGGIVRPEVVLALRGLA